VGGGLNNMRRVSNQGWEALETALDIHSAAALVEDVDEVIELGLLLKEISSRRSGRDVGSCR